MVSKKSIYYGRFDGFQAPMVPKAPRSTKRNSHRKSSEGSKLCAFDLLAAIADQLLQENESSTSSTSPEQKEQISIPKESPQSDNESGLEHVSDVKTSCFSNIGSNVKLEPFEDRDVDKMKVDAPSHGDSCDFTLVNSLVNIQTEAVKKQTGDCTFRDPVESCVNTPVLNKSFSRANLPFDRVNVKMGIRDDDENSFEFNHLGTKMRAFRAKSRAGYRRIRKIMASRYRKVTSKKDYELTNTTISETKPPYQIRKNMYSQEWCQTETPKRRKLCHKSGNGDSHVKITIKSFKVPKLYVEIPETATVASLKRTVMEAVSAILGGELRVGILLRGEKVKDNNRTLQQTGISRNCDLKTLGFTLEPKEPSFQDKNQETVATSAPSLINSDYHDDKNQELIPLQMELPKEGMADSKDLVPFLEVKNEARSIVPVGDQLTKNCEVSQRRIRRPFSVSEVEALVEAVETVGTGRWRDVKLRAFNDVNHRTYVDLKDKWKTLVHTAGISPQQRRGEPVPQDLLDRVLAAHSFWSQHQKKHQTKPVQILDGSSVELGCIKI